MSVIYFLIAIGILVAGGFLVAFIWSVRTGQYDDDYTPSVRMLFDNYKADAEAGSDKPDNDDKAEAVNDKDQTHKSINNKS